MCSLVEIMCVFEGKIELVCWQLLHDLYATDILSLNLALKLFHFLSNSINLSGIFKGIKKLRAFERNPFF